MKTLVALLTGMFLFTAVGCNAASMDIGNKICPVSGEAVGTMGDVVKYEHNGKVYSLCCDMCKKDFKKDPEKYSKIAEDEVAAQVGIGQSGAESHEGHQH